MSEPPGAQPAEAEEIPPIGLEPGESVEPDQPAEVKQEAQQEPKVKIEEKKEPGPPMTLPLALKRIHDKLQSPTELLKLRLKHYHVSTERFKRRTSTLKLPKEIYDKYETISSNVTLARRPGSRPQVQKPPEYGVKCVVNSHLLTMERLS